MVWCMAHGDEHSSQPSGEIQPLFHATAQDDESVAQMVALLDYQDALPSARRLHDWALETAGSSLAITLSILVAAPGQ